MSEEQDIDRSRRESLNALLGVLGGATGLAALSSCLQDGGQSTSGGERTGTLAQALSGTQVGWVNTVLGASPSTGNRTGGDLANNTPSSLNGSLVVVASGCIAPGDGGGGVFYWSQSPGDDAGGASTTGVDDGGTIIVPGGSGVGSSGPCWKRIYSGPLNVKWFGATGNGSESADGGITGTDDTVAIQNAINVAAAPANFQSAVAGDLVQSGPSVEFPKGVYTLGSLYPGGCPIFGSSHQPGNLSVQSLWLTLFSNEGAILLSDTPSAPILVFSFATRQIVRGLKFVGGTSHIQLPGGPNDSVVTIEHCEFVSSKNNGQAQQGYAIYQDATVPGGGPDLLIIRDCKFCACDAVLMTVCNRTLFENCHVTTASVMPGGLIPGIPGTACIAVYGSLRMRGCWCASAYTGTDQVNGRWIDSLGGTATGGYISGNIDILETAFSNGGASNATITPVLHWGPNNAAPQGRISVRDCDIGNLPSGPPPIGLGNTGPAVIAIASGCPQRMIVEGVNAFPASSATTLISCWQSYGSGGGSTAIWTYLASLTPAQIQTIKITLDSAGGWQTSTGVSTVYGLLLQYVDGFQLFPTGAQMAQPTGTNTSQAYITYNIPANIVGFVALVTISTNPAGNPSAGALLSTVAATYLVSLTSGYTTGTAFPPFGNAIPIDMLSSPVLYGTTPPPTYTPPFPQPVQLLSHSVNFNPPSIASIFFGPYNPSGYAYRSNPAPGTPQGGQFTITFNAGAQNAGNLVVSIQPIHVMPFQTTGV